MISDIDILSILQDRERYEKYYPHIEKNFLTREGEVIGSYINRYFSEDVLKNIDQVDWSKFSAWFFLKHPTMGFDQKANYKEIFSTLDSHVVDSTFFQNILEDLTLKAHAKEIGDLAHGIVDGTVDEDIQTIEEKVREAADAISELDTGDDPYLTPVTHDFLFASNSDDPVLQFSLGELRRSINGIRRGNFVVVGAYTDTGKTTFLIGECCYMLPQIPDDKLILYFNNEQGNKDMQLRIVCGLLGKPIHDVELDPVDALKDFEDKGGKRIHLYDRGYMTRKFVEDRIRKHKGNIGLIVFDQLWKIKGTSKSQNDFMQLAHSFAWARDICKEHAPVIAVHQADGTVMDTKYISMDHLFGSKVAVQGEADAIITIGRVTDGSVPDETRFFSVPKNKLRGSDPTARNNRFVANINHDMVKFEDI